MESLNSIQDLLEGRAAYGALVNVMGQVIEYVAPRATGGADFKCSVKLRDGPTDRSITVNIFRPENEMPTFGAGDVVMFSRIKVQQRQGEISLLTHKTTTFQTWSADRTDPTKPGSKVFPMEVSQSASRVPSHIQDHASDLLNGLSRPDKAVFEARTSQSRTFRDKFSELKDVTDQTFYDLIVQIVKPAWISVTGMTMWVTDYTENANFYNFVKEGQARNRAQAAGWTNHIQATDWPGPYGKMCVQVSCFDPVASAECRQLSAGAWVRLHNVRIKLGRNGGNLEAIISEGRSSWGRNSVEEMHTGNKDDLDPRLKAAIVRRLRHVKSTKKQLKATSNKDQSNRKRTADLTGQQPPNTKVRRQETRADLQREYENTELQRRTDAKSRRPKDAELPVQQSQTGETSRPAPVVQRLQSKLIKCEHASKAVSPLASILQAVMAEGSNGHKVTLPFTNLNYRARVRVVDFFPAELHRFACLVDLCDGLLSSSDKNDEDEDDSTSSDQSSSEACSRGQKVWQWRFSLQLEDASSPPQPNVAPDRMWVLVDNSSAQCLLNLDASNLRTDAQALETLRQQLFLLWGDLEEHKAAAPKRLPPERRRDNNLPPPSSSPVPAKRGVGSRSTSSPLVVNCPFDCCIRQYGVKTKVGSDGAVADAGRGRCWQRVFGLFGTMISHRSQGRDSP